MKAVHSNSQDIKKKVRARSKEKKSASMNNIINIGRELFITKGNDGFKMRTLADLLHMQQGNLYNYVKSKRELYFAILQDDHNTLKTGSEQIVQQHQGKLTDLLLKLAGFYFDCYKANPKQFEFMFSSSAPPSKVRGPFEKSFNPHVSYYVLREVVQNAIANKELREMDPDLFSHYFWAVIHGGSIVTQYYVSSNNGNETYAEDQKRFRSFLLAQLKNQLDLFYKKNDFF